MKTLTEEINFKNFSQIQAIAKVPRNMNSQLYTTVKTSKCRWNKKLKNYM